MVCSHCPFLIPTQILPLPTLVPKPTQWVSNPILTSVSVSASVSIENLAVMESLLNRHPGMLVDGKVHYYLSRCKFNAKRVKYHRHRWSNLYLKRKILDQSDNCPISVKAPLTKRQLHLVHDTLDFGS